jgi:hypothetical protein
LNNNTAFFVLVGEVNPIPLTSGCLAFDEMVDPTIDHHRQAQETPPFYKSFLPTV